MEKNKFEVSNGKVFGVNVSEYGLEKGYLDYRALAEIVDNCILNNTIRNETIGEWKIVAGEMNEMIQQDFIISAGGYKFLKEYTDEVVFYNDRLNLYIWGIDHWGTSWDYVLTNIKLI